MAKRRFNSRRTHKLVSRVVVIVALVFGLLGAIQLNNVFYDTYSIESIDKHCSGSGAKSGCETYVFLYRPQDILQSEQICSGSATKTYCESYYLFSRGDLENSGWRNLGIAAVLLVVFFGGTWLYRYMFPVQETEAEPDGS